jgi:hypothetical protein
MMIFLVALGQISKAQDNNNFRYNIKTNPLAALGGPIWILIVPITGEYKILFEAKTFEKQSVEIGLGYLGSSILLNLNEITSNDSSINDINVSGFRAQAAYKFFITKESAPEGFYIGPHISYASAKLKSKENPQDNIEFLKLNLNVLIGYQLITSGGFTLNIYTGLGFKYRDYSVASGSEDIFDFTYGNNSSPNVPFGFTFGYSF